jgi:hypothetical protein
VLFRSIGVVENLDDARIDAVPFKADVRKLKELVLTESPEVGYRLSPRARAVLKFLSKNLSPLLNPAG